MTHAELLARLEAATGPDRELDALIQEHVVGLRQYESVHRSPDGRMMLRYYPGPPGPDYFRLRQYTESVDDALTLVPVGCRWLIAMGGYARITGLGDNPPVWRCTDGATPALALCIAALKAREAANV